MEAKSYSDEELLLGWREGNTAFGDELVTRYFHKVSRFFRSKVGDDVEDLVQQTFLDVVKSKDKIDAGKFRPYVFRVAHNRFCDQMRRKTRRPEEELGSISVADMGTSPSQAFARDQRKTLLLHALRNLSLEQQVALELAYWEEMNGEEIAQVLSINPNTVRSRLSRARQALQAEFEKVAASPAVIEQTLSEIDEILARTA